MSVNLEENYFNDLQSGNLKNIVDTTWIQIAWVSFSCKQGV